MNDRTNKVVFVAIYVALAVVLSACTKMLPQMPNGGTLDLPVIAIFIASFHLGWKYGIGVGILSWLVGTIFGLSNYIVSPMQSVFDYIGPVTAIGIASACPRIKFWKFQLSNIYIGIFVGMFLKYCSHVLAGVYFWFPEGDAAGSSAAWIYSAWTYNLFYNVITMIFAMIVVPILLSILCRSKTNKFVGIKN